MSNVQIEVIFKRSGYIRNIYDYYVNIIEVKCQGKGEKILVVNYVIVLFQLYFRCMNFFILVKSLYYVMIELVY